MTRIRTSPYVRRWRHPLKTINFDVFCTNIDYWSQCNFSKLTHHWCKKIIGIHYFSELNNLHTTFLAGAKIIDRIIQKSILPDTYGKKGPRRLDTHSLRDLGAVFTPSEKQFFVYLSRISFYCIRYNNNININLYKMPFATHSKKRLKLSYILPNGWKMIVHEKIHI